MWTRIPLIVFLLSATWLLAATAEAATGSAFAEVSPYATPRTITNAAAFARLSAQEANRGCPLRLEGVVTRVDSSRNQLVLQDASGALALDMPLTNSSVHAGDHVLIEGASGIPCATAFPEFPAHPVKREVLDSFETATDVLPYSLIRLRGFVRPPKTGFYRFWIASKGASELWLSTNADPGLATRMASVPMGKNTNPRQWTKYPAQTSAAIFLSADTPCYIEALREQRGGRSGHLAVAWQGPGLQQSVIAGQYLLPWKDRDDAPSAAGAHTGILEETWTNFFVGAVGPLTVRSPLLSPVTVRQPRLKVLGGGVLPEPIHLCPGGVLTREQQFRRAEIEGIVEFAGRDGDALALEVAEGSRRTRVRIADWPRGDWPRLENARVRVTGVCEAALDAEGRLLAGTLWASSPADLDVLSTTTKDWSGLKQTPISQLSPTNPNLAWDRRIRVRGTLTRRADGAWVIEGQGSFWPYLSRDGTNWHQAAPPVEIGLGSNPLMGLTTTSLERETLARAVFDHVEGMDGVGTQADVYAATPPGSVRLTNSVYTIEGGGLGIGSAFDEFHYAYQALGNHSEIVARLKSVEAGNTRAHAGIMVRENLDASSPCVALSITPGRGVLFQVRRKAGARGEIMELPGYRAPCWLKLVRRYFGLVAHLPAGASKYIGQEVDVTGLLEWDAGQPVLREARCLEPPPPVMPIANAPAGGSDVTPIDKLLPQDGMALKESRGTARIRGVVTFCGMFDRVNYLAIQDDSGGALVRLSYRFATRPLLVGQLVEVGILSRNGKWPVPFDPGRINILGRAPLPEPVIHPAEYSLPLRGEGRWVEVGGMVRSAAPDGTLAVMGANGVLPVWVNGLPKHSAGSYVDSLVRVRGVLLQPEPDAPVLLVSSPGFVQVTEPAPRDPFVIPTIPIAQLKKMNSSPAQSHRAKVSGAVTYHDDSLLLVQDGSGGMRVQVAKPVSVNVGDKVEAAGFPEPSGGFFKLTEALVKRTGSAPEQEPARESVEDLLDDDFDATLVRVKALLLERRLQGTKQILDLQSGPRVFQAVLPKNVGELPALPSGSTVELTGVCLAERLGAPAVSETGKPLVSSFKLLLRSPRDVVLLERAPWWTWKHTVTVVSGLLLVLAAASVWIRQLRQRVAERTQELRATMASLEEETKTSATLAERNRLAAEIHDGLEQGLNGIMMQLDGVETKLKRGPEAAKYHLDLARKMVRFSRTEVRHSLWDWKAPGLANHDLKTALAGIVSQMTEGKTMRVAVEVSGESRPLPPTMEHHLLRICQEALTNALKHAHAHNITIRLNYADSAVELSVQDDGCGFEPDTVLNGLVGHLGLQNLRSRARNLGGELNVTSKPGNGATIAVRIPCPPSETKPN